MVRYLVNAILLILPVSGFFGFKRWLLGLANIDLADGCCVNGHTWFYGRGEISVGRNTWIGPGCTFYSHESVRISIGKDCDIAPEVAFVPGSHESGTSKRRAGTGYCKDIVVNDGCWIGTRATILGGVTIGRGAVVGAGALVNKDVPENSVVAGVPARKLKDLDAS